MDTKVMHANEARELLRLFMERQRRIYENKKNHGFNVTDFHKEVRYILGEVSELNEAIDTNDLENLLEEAADIVIFCYGLAEMAGKNLDDAIFKKMDINEDRVYKRREDGEFEKVKGE